MAFEKVLKYLLTLLILIITFFTIGTDAQVYQKPVQDTDRGRIVKTTSSKMVGARTFGLSWYCLKGVTASGSRVVNGVVAADPRVLPFGTKVMIQGYGTFVVRDSGSAIKGNRIDIWTPSCSNAIKLGRKSAQVIIIK